ncbi:3'-5'-exoribonuclease [Basidiobolus ranarum]|uniref:3'-5'-exoribonuclease n=1 Tax=Basidiobolus ranarum TaxID=34480 RepID=A0ABR2W4Z7_9FUNG
MDRKRINGPELSVAPIFKDQKIPAVIPLTLSEKRSDGRTTEELRSIFLKTGLISQANGSAYIELQHTKIACAIYGPRQAKKPSFNNKGELNCEFKFTPFSCVKRRGHLRDAQERELSQIITQALAPSVRLELFPKSVVDIYISVLESDGIGSTVAAAITCASVALADAGIEMLDLVAASSGGFFQSQVMLDCTAIEEEQQQGSLILSYMPSLNEVTHIVLGGETEVTVSNQAIEQCIDTCTKIYSVMNHSLLTSIEP